ncbi:pyocin knob domain-containing protein [Lactobacillus crispatus]|uniref:Phage tail protein n=1 Tax=Lactobacillus crispatus TaxID=47770 RepID=A0A7H9E845_9LACO|nr:hypothetical protein [Lactobacillus crispatus]QLL73796.1 hypothetical protein GTO85_05140 [Lactobacillus crispatus]
MSTIRDPAYITDAGRTMMTAGGDVTYTKAVLYGQDISHLTSDQVKALTTIGSPLREVKVGISDKQNTDRGTTVILEATFQNDNLANDLPYTAVGFFAQKGNDEKLIAVAVANTGAYLTATSPDGVATDALDLKLAIAIGDATNVTATVDPAGSVTPATLNGAINKATHDLTAQIDTKADKTTVEQELAIKANSTDVDKKLTTKANSSDVYTKKQIDDAFSSRDATIATKADKATVDAEISKIDFTPYAKTADVNKEIKTVTDLANTKVDATYSYSKAELDKKLLALSTDTSGKVDANQVVTMIEGKADKTDLDNEIKAVTDLANTKANTVDVDSKIKTVTDLANTKANSSDVYTKTETDNQINKFDLSKVKFRKQFLNGDGDKVDKTWSATKNDDGTYTIDLFNDDWTASKLFDVISQLPDKADKSNTYTKTDVDNKVNEAKSSAQSIANQIWGEVNSLKGKQTKDSADANALSETGVYYCSSPAKNFPVGQWGTLVTSNGNGARASQLYFPDDNSAVWFRTLNGNWQGWARLANIGDVNNAESSLTSLINAVNNKVNVTVPLFRRITAGNTWNDILGASNGDTPVLVSIRDEGGANTLGNYSAAVAFGGGDTKGVLNVAYSDHTARIIGGNGNAPVWHEDIAWKSDTSNLQNIINQQNQTIQSLTTRLTNAENEIRYIKANYVEGRTFPASQEAQANSWENENPQRIAFIER